jgi:phosphohistidine phosphatase
MKLYLVRHAAAVDKGTAITEEHRYLTSEGRAFFRKTARTMLKRGLEPGLILTSPLVRAVQTAEILAQSLEYIGPLVVTDVLAPGFDVAGLEKLLAAYRNVDELVLVGHEPDLGGVAAALLASPAGISLKKGAAIKLKIDGNSLGARAVFKWLAVGKNLVDAQEDILALRP